MNPKDRVGLWDQQDLDDHGLKAHEIPVGHIFEISYTYYLRVDRAKTGDIWKRITSEEAREILRGGPSDEDMEYVMKSLGVSDD